MGWKLTSYLLSRRDMPPVSAPTGAGSAGALKLCVWRYLAGWGKSVIVGRGKLGGIPMGVIAVETRTPAQFVASRYPGRYRWPGPWESPSAALGPDCSTI